MTVIAAALAGFAAAAAVARRGGAVRLSALRPRPARAARAGTSAAVASLAAGLAVAVLVGTPAGLVAGLGLVVAGPALLGRLEPGSVRREREQLVRELPLLLELLAACLAGGAALPRAGGAVAAALPGPCARRLGAVVDSLNVGSPPAEAWLALSDGSGDDPLAPTARLLARAAEGGTPVAAAVQRLAADARAAARAVDAQAARRVGVLVVAPLGLCFLPAFVLLGIVPVVAGLAGPLFRAS